ncbi:unnamed protein product [Urochloa humidicola]
MVIGIPLLHQLIYSSQLKIEVKQDLGYLHRLRYFPRYVPPRLFTGCFLVFSPQRGTMPQVARSRRPATPSAWRGAHADCSAPRSDGHRQGGALLRCRRSLQCFQPRARRRWRQQHGEGEGGAGRERESWPEVRWPPPLLLCAGEGGKNAAGLGWIHRRAQFGSSSMQFRVLRRSIYVATGAATEERLPRGGEPRSISASHGDAKAVALHLLHPGARGWPLLHARVPNRAGGGGDEEQPRWRERASAGSALNLLCRFSHASVGCLLGCAWRARARSRSNGRRRGGSRGGEGEGAREGQLGWGGARGV